MIGLVPYWRRRAIYLGWETELEPGAKRLSWFWFTEDEPPYGRGRGIRLRTGKDFALHIGNYRNNPDLDHLAALGGRKIDDVEPTEIAMWGIDGDLQEGGEHRPSEADQEAAEEFQEPGQAGGRRADRPAGDPADVHVPDIRESPVVARSRGQVQSIVGAGRPLGDVPDDHQRA